MNRTRRSSFAIGRWLVEPDRNQISTPTATLYLRPQVMDVLVYLAGLEGGVASLESIHDELWSGKVVSNGTLYNCIAELRQLLSRDNSGLNYIETIPKKGYRLAAPLVSRQAADDGSGDDRWATVAILPLENRSGSPEFEHLSDGVAEEILHRLCKVQGLRVYSALKLKEAELDPRVVGLRMSADAVLSGSLRTDGSRLQLTFRPSGNSTHGSAWSRGFIRTWRFSAICSPAISKPQ